MTTVYVTPGYVDRDYVESVIQNPIYCTLYAVETYYTGQYNVRDPLARVNLRDNVKTWVEKYNACVRYIDSYVLWSYSDYINDVVPSQKPYIWTTGTIQVITRFGPMVYGPNMILQYVGDEELSGIPMWEDLNLVDTDSIELFSQNITQTEPMVVDDYTLDSYVVRTENEVDDLVSFAPL